MYSLLASNIYLNIQINEHQSQFCSKMLQIERFVEIKKSFVLWRKVSAVSFIFLLLFSLGSGFVTCDDLFEWNSLGPFSLVLIPLMFAFSFVVWFNAEYYLLHLESVTTWSANYRLIMSIVTVQDDINKEILEVQSVEDLSTDASLSSSISNQEVQLTLIFREILLLIQQYDEPLDCQLVRLGVRPEIGSIVPIISWMKVEDASKIKSIYDSPDCSGDDALYIIDADVQSYNDNIQSQIKLLMELGMLRYSLGRLKVTVNGIEMLALPASLFVSNIPMDYRTWLGRADNLFHALSYEGSVNLCGKLWERFFQDELKSFASRVEQKSLFGSKMKDKPTLGDLLAYFSTYLELNPDVSNATNGKFLAIQNNLLAYKKEKSLQFLGHLKSNPYKAFYEMANTCVNLRNNLTHEREDGTTIFEKNSETISQTYRLLQFTRLAFTEYYAIQKSL